MLKILKTQTAFNALLILMVAFIFPNCNSNTVGDSGEWRVDYMPAEFGRYAGVNVYSTQTGEYYQLYANEGQWKKNPNFPTPPKDVKGGDLRMQYLPDGEGTLPGLCVYSAKSGDWKQYYLEDKTWKLNTNFPQPKVSVSGGEFRMDFIPGSKEALAGLTVYSTKTKQFEMFYLDGKEWKINTSFPTAKAI